MRILPIFALLVSLGSSSAWAANKKPNRQALEKTAKKACATGDYKTGIDILADLFVETDNPVYVHNQGRCYEQNSRYEQAIERFREYLRKATNLSDSDRATVEKHIAECENLMPKPVVAPAPAPQPEPLPQPPVIYPAASVPPAGVAASVAPKEASGAGLRTAGLVTAGFGVAALVAGIVLNFKHESLVDKQNKDGFSRARESDISTYQTWSWVGYGVGAAAVLAGGTMYFIGRSSGRSAQQSVSLLPVVDVHGAGCLLQGAF